MKDSSVQLPMTQHHHHHQASKIDHTSRTADGSSHDCKCPIKCACVSLCAAGGGGLVPVITLLPERIDAIAARLFVPNDSVARTTVLTEVFRPPSLAPS